jgi:two-component system response regulator
MTTIRTVDVLLVDDAPADVELTIHVLRHNKLANSIQVAEDGKEALDFLFRRGDFAGRDADDHPKLILLDLKLPKVDGLEVLQAIRADERTRAIPVVILTSSKEQSDLIKGYQFGTNAFIQKPVDFAEFQHVIKEVGLFWLLVNEPPPCSSSPSHSSEQIACAYDDAGIALRSS